MDRSLSPTAVLAVLLVAAPVAGITVFTADFDTDEDGFSYSDDTFRGTSEPSYASGSRIDPGGFSGGALRVLLGGIDGTDITGMSGGWQRSFNLASPEELELTIQYDLNQLTDYEGDEVSQLMVSVDGVPIDVGANDYVMQIEGDGNGGPTRSTGWTRFSKNLGTLSAGAHTLTIGAYNSKKTTSGESTDLRFDDVLLATPAPSSPNVAVQTLVDDLDAVAFEANVGTLAAFGSRYWSQQGNIDAGNWIETQLASYGYTVERHTYTFSGQQRDNIFATKVGSVDPDEMYIVSAHMDSFNTQSGDQSFAPGADDDASGTSLVLEAARVFAPASVETEKSVRFILWNNEETGLDGSEAYVSDRAALQGIESPLSSGQYPEPTWLGVIQHDMIMLDHGLPHQPTQIPGADIDIEFQADSNFGGAATDLATALFDSNATYATDYPAEVTSDMSNTDSESFETDTPSVSVRENRRLAEIGNGANPNWHKNSDVVATYSALDFLFGFNVVQTTVGAIAVLSGVSICGDGAVGGAEQCDDGNTTPGDCCSATCTFEAVDSPCDDSDACTQNDRCDGSGSCNVSDPVVCDDSQFCNGVETCDSGSGCQAGTPPPLDDGVACTIDTCDEVLDQVVNTPDDAFCSDGAFCTGVETCAALLDCQAGAPPPLDDGVDCTIDSCDEVVDQVVHTPDDAFCSDGEFCTGAEICDALLDCQAGAPPPLDDGVACTIDTCDDVLDQVVHTPDDPFCSDGAFCTGVETCDALLDCQAGTPPPLDDGVACTLDSCDEVLDQVVHDPDDASCDDLDACTADSCDEISGCAHDPIPFCGAPVPTTRPWALVLLAALVLAAASFGIAGGSRTSA